MVLGRDQHLLTYSALLESTLFTLIEYIWFDGMFVVLYIYSVLIRVFTSTFFGVSSYWERARERSAKRQILIKFCFICLLFKKHILFKSFVKCPKVQNQIDYWSHLKSFLLLIISQYSTESQRRSLVNIFITCIKTVHHEWKELEKIFLS